jgi:diaminopimelate epimerase
MIQSHSDTDRDGFFTLEKMKQKFYKYQGTGNDFVIIDDRAAAFPKENTELVANLCNRKFGIGADGLMLLRTHEGFDFEMVYFNSDGKEGSMCGNGGRALVQFAYDLGIIKGECKFIASDGEHLAKISEGLVHLKMIDVEDIEITGDDYFMNTGSPHHIEFVDELKNYPVFEKGKEIRESIRYIPNGTNVNFVELLGKKKIAVRTFERGVEDETLSCGTGVTACAIATFLEKEMDSPIQIEVLGGKLSVSFEIKQDIFTNIYLIGPAEKVFEGEVEI